MQSPRDIASYALTALTAAGAQDAQVSVSSGRTEEFNVDGGQFSLLRTLFNSSLSLTAYLNGKKGSVAVNRLERDAIDQAVADCIAAARSGVPDAAYGIAEGPQTGAFTLGALTSDRARLFDRTAALLDALADHFPTVLMEQLIVSHTQRDRLFANTNGVEWTCAEGEYGVSAMFSAHEGEKASSFCGTGFSCADLDRPFLDCGSLRATLDAVTRQVHTQPVAGKFEGTILLPPDSLGSFLDMTLGNFACDSTLIDGTSPWRHALGTTVADPRLTVSAAPLDERIVCGERYTADGYRSENYDIIRDGVLRQYMLSRYGARKTGLDRAPNSSWNFIVPPGDTPLDDLIAGIDRGLVVGRFSGGNPGTSGDFSGVAKNSFLIEGGRITNAVSETMISGNLAALLTHLVGLSRETVADGNVVLPWAAFDGVTISGN